jgi:hypothetical protein
METQVVTRRKPPYASAGAIDTFFEKIKSIGPPTTVDSKWAVSYGLDVKLPASIPTMLKWIGVIDDNNKPVSSDVWNKIRFANTRTDVLAPLVREGYREIFEAITVEDADKEIIEATFGQTYGSGDVGRVVTCFLTLCRQAGITTKVGAGRQANGQTTQRKTRTVSVVTQKPKKQDESKGTPKSDRGQSHPLALALNLTVEIPADWTEEQIEKRIETISKALQATIS